MKEFIRHAFGRLVHARLLRRSQPLPATLGPVLVVAPHADDETLGCGGLLAREADAGRPVMVVFVTDSAGGANPPSAGLARTREREARAALAALGVVAERAHFLGAPDGRLDRLDAAEAARVEGALAGLVRTFRPAAVFVPCREDGSAEHAAAVAIAERALAAAAATPVVWEYAVWAWWDPRRLLRQARGPGVCCHLELGMLRARKQAALACHASQLSGGPATDGFRLPPTLAALCTQPTEFFFRRP